MLRLWMLNRFGGWRVSDFCLSPWKPRFPPNTATGCCSAPVRPATRPPVPNAGDKPSFPSAPTRIKTLRTVSPSRTRARPTTSAGRNGEEEPHQEVMHQMCPLMFYLVSQPWLLTSVCLHQSNKTPNTFQFFTLKYQRDKKPFSCQFVLTTEPLPVKQLLQELPSEAASAN